MDVYPYSHLDLNLFSFVLFQTQFTLPVFHHFCSSFSPYNPGKYCLLQGWKGFGTYNVIKRTCPSVDFLWSPRKTMRKISDEFKLRYLLQNTRWVLLNTIKTIRNKVCETQSQEEPKETGQLNVTWCPKWQRERHRPWDRNKHSMFEKRPGLTGDKQERVKMDTWTGRGSGLCTLESVGEYIFV